MVRVHSRIKVVTVIRIVASRGFSLDVMTYTNVSYGYKKISVHTSFFGDSEVNWLIYVGQKEKFQKKITSTVLGIFQV